MAVKGDYYAILGVSPASEDVVIRAAYRALMRRYHPDTDPSGDATDRARAINAAYAVLSDPDKRARYDAWLAAHGLIKPDPLPGAARALPRPGPAAVGALGLLAALLILIAISPPLAELPGAPAVAGGSGAAAGLVAEQVRPAAAGAGAGEAVEACSDAAAHGLIKSELFERAARLRGSDAAGFRAVADRALVRVALAEAVGREGRGVSCSGWLAIDLPPGVVVEGARRNLNAGVDFSLVPGRIGEFRLAGLSGAEGLVASLSSLARAPQEDPALDPAAAPPTSAAAAPVRIHRSTAAPVSARAVTARHSRAPRQAGSSCAGVSGRAGQVICRSSNLAALDRHLVLFTDQSLRAADARKKAALEGSSERFRRQRDSCRTESCMTSAYLAQMREVSDIMAGRPE